MDVKHQAYLTDLFLDCLKKDNETIKSWLKEIGITNIPDDVLEAINRIRYLKWLPKAMPINELLQRFEDAGAANIIDEALRDKDYITYTDAPHNSHS